MSLAGAALVWLWTGSIATEQMGDRRSSRKHLDLLQGQKGEARLGILFGCSVVWLFCLLVILVVYSAVAAQ